MTTRVALLAFSVSVIASVGCDQSGEIVLQGSGGSRGSVEPEELRVVATTPEDGEEGVELGRSVTARLNRSLDSLDPFDLELELRDERGTLVPGAVSIDARWNRIVFTPDEPFDLELGYTATVNRRFKDVEDDGEEPSYTWSFEARDGRWSESTELGFGPDCTGRDAKPRMAMTATGNAVAAWISRGVGGKYICSQRFDPATGWGEVFQHPQVGYGNAVSNLEVAMDSAGNAVIASRQTIRVGPSIDADTHVSVFAATFDAASGEWDVAQRLDPFDLGTNPPVVVIDDAGHATVVWQGLDATSGLPIWMSRSTPGDGWSEAERLIDNPHVTRSPSLAIDGRGEVFLTASQFCIFSRCIVTMSFAESFGWTPLASINPSASTFSERPALAVNADGAAAVVWHQAESNSWPFQERAPSDIWASHLTPSLGWTEPALLEVGSGDISPPHVAVDETGNAIAVWGQYEEAWSRVYASRFTEAEGWGPAEPISEPHLGETRRVRIALDPSGKAIAVWEQALVGQEVWTNRFTPKRGWRDAERLARDIPLRSEVEPQVAIDAKGRALVVWSPASTRALRFE